MKDFYDFHKYIENPEVKERLQRVTDVTIDEILKADGTRDEKIVAICHAYSMELLHKYHEWASQGSS